MSARDLPPLLPTDSLVASIERIWGMRPTVIEMRIGTSNDPYCTKPTSWTKAALSRDEAANALRAARMAGLKVEPDRTGYTISGGFA